MQDPSPHDQIATAAEAEENDRLPRLHEVHADPNRAPADEATLPAALKKPGRKSPARWAYERLILYIQNFEKQLDGDQEAAMGFTGGDAGVIRIEGLGYFDPDIVTFYGSDPAGARTQVIQHVSQLNVLLRAMPKVVADEAPQRIGFRLARDLESPVEDADEA
ncbi:DUF6173 family protein [Wenxinia marina]|uniref:Uncharacterized protein n=1 Tax=Wenxinia marina DSM 24838 TaxID=1123501 RepID=A0A0D0NPY8_9RHOB|nr:DUF6173 family protein [Wenxinia marina]KIQ70335.1 hypothetical protein Wenmar_00710 [Wenxinia marina DSM 24838]GGL53931.1 hypothetical protein GCM10011392_05410 [Wenxinia marina]